MDLMIHRNVERSNRASIGKDNKQIFANGRFDDDCGINKDGSGYQVRDEQICTPSEKKITLAVR